MKNSLLRILLFFLLSVLGVNPLLIGQTSIPSITDLSRVNVDQLSDDQVKSLFQKAMESGLSLDQLGTIAIAKGMPQSEFTKLKIRINKINTGFNSESTVEDDRGRKMIGQIKGPKVQPDLFETILQKNDSVNQIPVENRIFGYGLFNTPNITFEPSLNVPTPKNYSLGAGDEINIDVWGASQKNYKLTISPDGQIFIPDIGPISIAGLALEDASQKIILKLKTIYSGLTGSNPNTFAQVTLGNIRSIQVMVIGEVVKPGSYTVSSLSSVFNALYYSGGPNSNGSMRSIDLIRNNKVIQTIDVYDFLLKGDQKGNIRLQDQDIIHVNPYRWRVEISGEVKHPAIYELKDTSLEKLNDVINYTGGFTDRAYTERLRIYRKTNKERSIRDVQQALFNNFNLHNGDSIQVDKVLERFENRVTIEGAVYRPGEYSLDDNMTFLQLIEKAEGIKGDGLLTRSSIYRIRNDFSIEVIPVNLQLILNGSQSDIVLQREDLIKIPSMHELKEEYTFEISGDVKNPGQYPFIEDASVKDLILMAGGLLESAAISQVEVARRIKENDASPDNKLAEIYTFSIDRTLSISDSASRFILQPFDHIFIRRSPGYMKQALVEIQGEVLFPGSYALSNKTERISDMIKRVGGLSAEAYPNGAQLIRRLSTNQREREQALQTIMQESSDSLKFNVNAKSKDQAIGIDLNKILLNPNSEYDLILEEGDVLRIPKQLQTVRLSGALLYPVSVRFDKSYSFKKYISEAGGFGDDAKKSKTYVLYANGSIDKTTKLLFINIYPKIQPGSEIIVPQKPKKEKISTQEALGITSAFSSIALILVTMISKL